MSLSLRSAVREDSASILSLMTDVIRATVDESHQTATIENVAGNLTYWEKNANYCVHLVAEIEKSIVGVILIKEFWNLCSLFVDIEHHRQGIGRRLIHEAINICRSRSPKDAIFLNSSPFAVPFYNALGFNSRQTSQLLHPGVVPMMYRLAGS